MIYHFQPYSTEKNLGKAYNDHIKLIGDDDVAVLTDGDTCWLTPDYGMVIAEYVDKYPDAVLTCWTNRINEKAEQQSKATAITTPFGSNLAIEMPVRDIANMADHLRTAEYYSKQPIHATPLHGFVSGFCLVVPKKIWDAVNGFAEKQVYEDRGPYNLLGVDNDFTNRVRAAGFPILRMESVYIWHTYRLLTGDRDKSHLL